MESCSEIAVQAHRRLRTKPTSASLTKSMSRHSPHSRDQAQSCAEGAKPAWRTSQVTTPQLTRTPPDRHRLRQVGRAARRGPRQCRDQRDGVGNE